MNLFLYFCIPLVVTGEATSGMRDTRNTKVIRIYEDNLQPQPSGTQAYSKYAYGADVSYRNAALVDYISGGQKDFQRRPSIEDSGAVGKPSVYQNEDGNDEHPSLITANIYNSLKDKKINGQTQTSRTKSARGVSQEISPLNYDGHNQQDTALLTAQPEQNLQPNAHAQAIGASPQLIQTSGAPVYLQNPHIGQNLLVPQYQSPLTSGVPVSYQPQLLAHHPGVLASQYPGIIASHPGVLASHHPGALATPYQGVLAHHPGVLASHYPGTYYPGVLAVPPSKLHADHVAEQHHAQVDQQVVTKQIDPALQYDPTVIKTAAQPHVLLKPETNQLYYYGSPVNTAPAHAPVLLRYPLDPASQHPYQHQYALLNAHPQSQVLVNSQVAPQYEQQSLLLKEAHQLNGGEHLVNQNQLLKSHNPLLLKGGPQIVYQTPFQQPAPEAPVLLKNPAAHTSPNLVKTNASPTYKTMDPALYQNHVLKTATAPVVQPTLLKTSGDVEAHIVPAIEQEIPSFEDLPEVAKAPLALHHPQLLRYVPSDVVASKHPKVILQQSLIKNPPVYTEKEILKTVYAQAPIQKAVNKAPLATHYFQTSHAEPGLPATILRSQKSLVKALISSDQQHRGKHPGSYNGKTILELVPSLSYGQQSYSLYPKPNGVYGPPEPFQGGGGGYGYASPQHHHH